MGGESVAYTATDYILLDCGASSSNSISDDGRTWVSDERSKYAMSNSQITSFVSIASRQENSVTQVPYMTARVFHDKFTYSFSVSPGLKFLRLYFYPIQYSGFDGTTSFFSVTANNHLLVQNFSAYLTRYADDDHGLSATLIKEFMVSCSGTEKLNVTFSPSPNSLAFVNGIEVVSMPENMYIYHQPNSLSFVNNERISFDISDSTAFETVSRLNVGGATVANVDDTGMFRTWCDDSPYIFGAATGITPSSHNLTIKYSESTPAWTAPATIYTTSRTMGADPNINMKYNLTWNFYVDSGFGYLLRLHFCEIQPEITKEGQRIFKIFINNRTAEADADVIHWSGGNSIPVYRDYVLLIPNEGPRKQILWLALHPEDLEEGSMFGDAILNGLEIFRFSNSNGGSLAVPNPEPRLNLTRTPPKPKNGKRIRLPLKTIIGVALGCTALVSVSLILSLIFWRNKLLSSNRRNTMERGKSSTLPDQLCQSFTLEEILEATNNLDDASVIGRGGFGDVYRGFMKGIQCEVAIKRLNLMSKQGAREFWTEIQLLSQLRYVNLLSLIGYCNDSNEMILVYEYMANGNLRDHLYNTPKAPLSWKQRLEICIGAARGLDYLHSGAVHRIIHRDVKSTNILLDENYVAKVSDFGLSKMSHISMTNVPVTTVVKGTFGYMDPEYYRRQHLTEKSDVYSFGVVLFEVLCGRPAVDSKAEYSHISLSDWAWKCVENGSIGETIDPFLKGIISPICLRKYVNIAESCIRKNGCERPSMNDVAQGLEFALQLQQIDDAEEKLVMKLSPSHSQCDI